MAASKLARRTARKNWEGQFKSQSVCKTEFEKKAESLKLTTDAQIRNSKEMKAWALRYFETRYIPEWYLSTIKIGTSDALGQTYKLLKDAREVLYDVPFHQLEETPTT
jgi:hypothetical protein